MKRALATAAALVGAGVAVRRLRSRSGGSGPEPNRWLTVTVNQPPERFGEIPAPLAKLADHVEIRTSPAPGGRAPSSPHGCARAPPPGR